MKKTKVVFTVVAFILSAVLLAGGIVTIAIDGRDKENSAIADSVGKQEITEGKIKPEKLPDGGWGICSGDFCLELYVTENGYGTQITNKAGEVVEEQVNPINIQIKKPNAEGDYLGTDVEMEMLAADYEKLEVKNNTIIATSRVQSTAGSVFEVVDQYVGCEDGRFELNRDIKVVESVEVDEGFNSIVKFKEKDAGTYEDYEYFIPSVLYRDSGQLPPSAIGSNLALDYVWVRDTNMGVPMVAARNKENGFSFSLGRIIEGKVTTGIDESQGSWVISKNLDYGSNGFSNVDGYVSMDICYPGMEGNINYLDKGIPFLRRSHPVREDVVHTYKVLIQASEEDSFTDAMVAAYKSQFNRNQKPDVDADLDKVYSQTMKFLNDFTQEYAYGRTGMPFGVDLEGDITALDQLIGFIGQQTSVGFHLIRDGITTGDAEKRQKGEDVIDGWVRDGFTEYGFPRVWFGTTNYEWASTSLVNSYVRYMSDGMEGILDAYLEEKSDGVEKLEWFARCEEYADWLVQVQNEDGSYYRAYNPDTGEVSAGEDGKIGDTKNNSSCPVRYLVRMYEQTGKEKYLNAATRAGEYIYEHGYLTETYYGGACDRDNTIDKEAGVMAMYAFNSLYQVTGEEKWLDAAEHAAICAASFVYTFDFSVWGAETYNIYRDTVGTSGLSRIGVGGSAVDPFAAYLYYEYFKLYVFTGEQFYYDLAELIQDNTKQLICIDGSLPYALDGIVDEAQAVSNMFYAGDVQTCLSWCNIAMIDPIASMEDAFGVKTIEEAQELGKGELFNCLKKYGAGGNFR